MTQTHVNFHEGDVLALTVRFDSCGKTDIITGSEEHPFYVLDVEDYVPMVDLQPDMRLKTDNGSLATVVELKPLDESMELYNLTVEHVQNYYVFTSEDDPGVLVHNTGPCGIDPFDLNLSQTVQNHLDDITKAGTQARPYGDSRLLIGEIMEAGSPIPDPGGLPGGLRWDVTGTFNGRQGAWELVIDTETNTVVHFLFKGN